MKKILLFAMALILCLSSLVSCGKERNVNAKEGEAADGFLWEHNFSEITITGYIGASNDIKIPAKINDKPVTKIASGAFSGFTSMKSLEIPSTVKVMDEAFINCSGLESVKIYGEIESMKYAFISCTSLKDVVLGDRVKNISYGFTAYYYLNGNNQDCKSCTALEKITIPSSVESAAYAFSVCSSLKEVEIEEGVENINGAFRNTSLEKISIPSSVKTAREAFLGCTSLKEATISEGVTNLTGAFFGCTSLENLTIPDSVNSLNGIVDFCSSLKTIEFPNTYKNAIYLLGTPSIERIKMSEESLSMLKYILHSKVYNYKISDIPLFNNSEKKPSTTIINENEYTVYHLNATREYNNYDNYTIQIPK